MFYKENLPENISIREIDKLTAYVGYSNSDMNLFGQYENAVDILINKIIEEKHRIDSISHPLLYLMRHTIELGLKENIKYLRKYSKLNITRNKTHSLKDLALEFERNYYKIETDNNFDNFTKEEFKKYISDLNDTIQILNEDASAFRYTLSADSNKIFEHSDTINVFELKKLFDNSVTFLTHLADVISPYTNYLDFAKADKKLVENDLKYCRFCFDKSQKDWLIEKLDGKYKIVKEKLIWFDEQQNCYLNLKIANKKCYVIHTK